MEFSSDVYLPFISPECSCCSSLQPERPASTAFISKPYSSLYTMTPPSSFPPYHMVPIQRHEQHSNSLPGLNNNTNNKDSQQNLNTFGKLGSPSLDEFFLGNFENTDSHLTIDEDDQRKTFYSAESAPLTDSFVNFSNLDVHFIDN